jgi:hypothetical protein
MNKLSCGLGILGFALSACCSLAAWATDDGRYDGLEPRDTFKIRIGYFLANDYDTTVRLDSRRFLVGTLIDLEEDLNVDSTGNVWRIDGFYRFNERHRLSFNTYSSRRDGEVAAGREFVIGDPDRLLGGIVIPVGAEVITKMNFDLYKIGYGYSFVNRRKFEATLGAGVNFRHLDFEVSYQAQLGNRVRGDYISATEWVPLPTIGFAGRWNFTEKLETNIRFEAFYLQFDNYEGYYQEALLNLEHATFKHVGFGLGLNYGFLDLHGREDDIQGELNSRVLGLVGYLKAYF